MVAFEDPRTEERGHRIRKFIAAAEKGRCLVAGTETAAKLNKALEKADLPFRVKSLDVLPEGTIYALVEGMFFLP